MSRVREMSLGQGPYLSLSLLASHNYSLTSEGTWCASSAGRSVQASSGDHPGACQHKRGAAEQEGSHPHPAMAKAYKWKVSGRGWTWHVAKLSVAVSPYPNDKVELLNPHAQRYLDLEGTSIVTAGGSINLCPILRVVVLHR
jgi:hypothetical protein